jgi:diguanylate cyclase (GGDEF)-like protein/PAS domain S-box-containing protein
LHDKREITEIMAIENELSKTDVTKGSNLNVGHLAHRAILECSPGTPIAEACLRMHEAHCSSIVVVEGNRAVGIWTGKDALNIDVSDPQALDNPISFVMSSPVQSIRENESIRTLTFRFESERIRHLLVVNDYGDRVGIVSQSDIINNQGIEFFVQMRQVGSVMKRTPLTVDGDLSLNDGIRMMAKFKQDCMVVDHQGQRGILTETDVLRLVGLRQGSVPVKQVASFPLFSVSLETSLYKARRIFSDKQIRHIGVVEGDTLIGILTYSDILVSVEQAYVRELQEALTAQAKELTSSRKAVALAQKVAAASMQAILITDQDGNIESVNPAFTAITGYSPNDVVGHNPRFLKSTRHDSAFFMDIFQHLARYSAWNGEIWNRRKNGEEFPCQLTISVVRGDRGDVANYVGVFSDLCKEKKYLSDLHETRRKLENQEDLNRLMLESLPINAFIKDREGRYVAINDRAASFFGFPVSALLGRTDFEIFDKSTAEQLRKDDEAAGLMDQMFMKEISVNHRDNLRHLLVHKRAVNIQNDRYIIGASVDITERKKAEQILNDERAILAMVACGCDVPETLDAICVSLEKHLHGGHASVMLLEENGTCLRNGASPGLDPAYIRAIDGMEIGPDQGSCGTAVYTGQQVIVADVRFDPRWENYRELASLYGIGACWSTPILGANGKPLGTLAVYYNTPRQPLPHELELVGHMCSIASITLERAQATDRLHKLATTDALTQLPNRRQFLALAGREIARAARSGESICLCMMDVDRFKLVNDSYGHAAGDTVLQVVAKVIECNTRNVDICGRLGGEEFAVILPTTDLDGAYYVAERIRTDLEQSLMPVGPDGGIQVTISIGLCLLVPPESLDELMIRADEALYAAKHAGRNQTIKA